MRKEDILAECVDGIKSGRCILDDCLLRYPELGPELVPMLRIAASIWPEMVAPSAEFKQRARERLLEAMWGPAASPEKKQQGVDWVTSIFTGGRLRFVSIVASVLLVSLITGSATAYAAQQSLPGDVLYPVKAGLEDVRLVLALTPVSRATLHLEMAQRRSEEIAAQSSLGRSISAPAVEEVAIQIDAAIKEISRVKPEDSKALLDKLTESTLTERVRLSQASEAATEAAQPAVKQALDAAYRGSLIAGLAHSSPSVLSSPPSVSDENLEKSHFQLEGTLFSVEGGVWNVGGLLLQKVKSTGTPAPGSRVEIEGLVQGGETTVIRIRQEAEADNQVRIKGVFVGANPDGTLWYISGIPVGIPKGTVPPSEGKVMELAGTSSNGVFTSAGSESAAEERVDISGILAQVSRDKKTVAIEVLGARIMVNVSQAQIEATDGRSLTVLDLQSLVGSDLKVTSAQVKNGLLYAKEIVVKSKPKPGPAQPGKDKDDKENGKDRSRDAEKGQEPDKNNGKQGNGGKGKGTTG